MAHLLIEAIIIGLVTAVVGTIVSTLFMLTSKSFSWKKYTFWPRVFLSYLVSGFLIHLLFEITGSNKWYCKHGTACRKIKL